MKIPTLLFLLTASLMAKPTFNEHIAPMVHEKCTSCHRPGQSGPFPLITYKDVRKRSGTIEEVLLDRYMPPWKPVNENVHYANDRRLSDKQIALFSAWVEAGTPEGDPEKKPTPPEFPSDWYLGKPDMVITMKGTFEVPAEGRDIYRSFVFPLQLPEDKWVKAVELRPKAKSSVHHALFFIDSSGQARKDDGKDGKAGFRGMSFLRSQRRPAGDPSAAAFGGSNGLGGHVPGATPAKLPGDLAMFLPKGSDIVMQTHFHPSGKKEVEQAELALYFTDKAPEKNLVPIQIPPAFGRTARIDIPAGEKNYLVEDSMTLPVPVEAVLVGGHAHYICRTMTMTATLPDGKVITLIDIQDWDLDWQDRYQFDKRISLPAGTVLKTKISYDNSAANPENPFSPPRRIKWGQESTDEMGSVTLTVVPKNKEDAPALAKAQREHLVRTVTRRMVPDKGGTVVKDYDKNKDGLIQEEEIPQRHRRMILRRYDKDRNKVLNQQEQAELQKGLNALRGVLKR
jgi:hypothetical protein